jgi:hypothetical protein
MCGSMTTSTAIAHTEQTSMPGPNSSQLDQWLDEEIDSLVRSIETEAEAEAAPASRATPSAWSRLLARRTVPHAASGALRLPVAFGGSSRRALSRRALGRLATRRSHLVLYGFAVAVALVLGWLIPFLDRP